MNRSTVLSPRQAQALAAAATGATLREIAERLDITREYVSVLLTGAYRRLGVDQLPRSEKRPAAVREAVRRGLIPDLSKEISR
ncbi:sigma factor-like helix-turn-helix DNA-binding protein [Streptomyces sp. YKOK-I1]